MRNQKRFLVLLAVMLFSLAVCSTAFATESLIISQIVQEDLEITMYAQLINVENNTVVNAAVNKENLSVKLNAGSGIQPTTMELFSNTQEGVAYIVVLDQNVKLVSHSTILNKYKKALQELRNSLGDKDYVKVIMAGKTARSAFSNSSNGFTRDFTQFDNTINNLRDDNTANKPMLYEAIKLATDSFLSRQKDFPKRQVIIVFTLGKDHSSYQADELISAATAVGTPIYVVGIDGGDNTRATLDEMGRLARSTKGQVFTASDYSQPFEAVNRIVSWIRNTFVLTLHPAYSYFGNPNLSWTLSINTENRTMDSTSYSQSLEAVVTPSPSPVPTPVSTSTPKAVASAVPTAVPQSKLATFITSPLGMILLGVLAIVIISIVVLLVRNRRSQYVQEDDESSEEEIPSSEYDDDETKAVLSDGETIGIFGGDEGEETLAADAQILKLRLFIDFDGLTEEKLIPLSGSIHIGRKDTNNVVLKDPSVSRSHCTISYRNGEMYVEDDHSRCGTLLNGHAIHTEKKLIHGDKLKLGNTTIRIEVLGA